MPLSASVDDENKMVHLIASGIVNGYDLMEYEREYWIGDQHLGYHHCVDLRQALLDVEFAELLILATHAAPSDDTPYTGARTALIVGGKTQTEQAEFYLEARHQICPPFIRELAIFEDTDAARDWALAATATILLE